MDTIPMEKESFLTVDGLRSVFLALSTCENWSLQLLRIRPSKRNGISYLARELILFPEDALTTFMFALSMRYTRDKGVLDSIQDIRNYDGSAEGKIIYVLDTSNPLITDGFGKLINSMANPDTELSPLDLKASAYTIGGSITLGDEEKTIKIVTMQKPVTILKHKFLENEGVFREISQHVLSLRASIDVLIMDDKVYMFSFAGEKLFNMEHAYKIVCAEKLGIIKKRNILTDFESFERVAINGHNPRRFVSFKEENLEKLENIAMRARIANQFDIAMADDGRFDTTRTDVSGKIIKLLCGKGMINPFDKSPMEVTGAKQW